MNSDNLDTEITLSIPPSKELYRTTNENFIIYQVNDIIHVIGVLRSDSTKIYSLTDKEILYAESLGFIVDKITDSLEKLNEL